MIAAKVASSGALEKIAADWKLPMEIAIDLVSRHLGGYLEEMELMLDRQVKISLFDFILYVDDSGSMAFEEGGERIDDLKL